MSLWLRLLIGGAVGVLGVAVYVVARTFLETSKKPNVFALAGIAVAGMLLAGFGGWIIGPVSVDEWVQWTFVGAAATVCVGCMVALGRGRLSSTPALIAAYLGGLSAGLLALQLTIDLLTD
ncbi:hypothetical protein [Cryptosporangium aurantiacum]|uniref:Uncharacterized protein n=1 Tax=Cryptosporangium aurantiacum TaxID=134849 RepID=A0A1M7Q7J9_9ACTN|nr:hypothetical protein [Cryptosporangium aurantiacum]SHN26556.1 hypothetical protein SAMN05443668_104276 [Cryptosporangium aurantiacum]